MSQVRNTEFIDIQEKCDPKVTDYLPLDLKRNWEKTWCCSAYNAERQFNESPCFFAAKKKLWYSGWVTLVGGVGEGKSCTAEHLVTSFVKGPWQYPEEERISPFSRDGHEARNARQKENFTRNAILEKDRPSYEPVWVTTPDDLEKVDRRRPQIVVIDDLFGVACFSMARLELWRPHLAGLTVRASTDHPTTLLVVCVSRVHLEALPEDVAQLELFRTGSLVDVKGGHQRLLPNPHIQSPCDSANGLLSYLQGRCQTLQREEGATDITMAAAIDKVYRFDKTLYYTMAVAVALDGKLNLSKDTLAEYDNHTQNMMKELITILEVPEPVDLAKMRYAAQKLLGFFFQPDGMKWLWRMTHQKVLQMCAKSMFNISAAGMLKIFSREFLLDHIRTLSCNIRRDDLAIQLAKEHYEALGQRYTFEIMSGFMNEVIKNQCWEDETFVNIWFASEKRFGNLQSLLHSRDSVLNRSVFYWACYYGKGPVVKAILESGDLVPLRSEEWFQQEMAWGLQAACATNIPRSSAVVVQCLLSRGVQVNARDEYVMENAADIFGTEMAYFSFLAAPAIHVAARRGDLETVKTLIDFGARVTESTKDGMTPLHRATSRSRDNGYKIVELLLEKGADWNVKSTSGRTALHEAFISGSMKTVQALVDAGADLNDKMPDGRSFLSMAIQSEQKKLVDYLLYKIDVKKHSFGENFNPLHHAVNKRDSSLVETLIEKGADVDRRSGNGWTALHMACFFADDKMAETLVNKGADVNRTTNDGKTALHIAAMQGNVDMCDLLVGKGAKPELTCGNGDTAVVLAARGGHKMVVWLLLKEGLELETTPKAELFHTH